MFDCGCADSCDYYDSPEFYRKSIVKARKTHTCCECEKEIKPGEKYEYYVVKFDGVLSTYKTCNFCQTVRSDFNSCAAFGELWEDLKECWGEDAELLGV